MKVDVMEKALTGFFKNIKKKTSILPVGILSK